MSSILPVFILLFALFAVFHYVALVFSLYWYYWWFDIVMHFWGGMLLGLLFHIVTKAYGSHLQSRVSVLVGWLLAVTVGWEIFEFVIKADRGSNYLVDTSIDIAMGLCGGLLVYLIARAYTMR
jgi:hypothetical protein